MDCLFDVDDALCGTSTTEQDQQAEPLGDLGSQLFNDTLAATIETIDKFRESQYHYGELSVLVLLGLYGLLLVVGVAGNFWILGWMCCVERSFLFTKRNSSLLNPFLVNLCISDQLVLISCCPLMAYSKATSFWHMGPPACSGLHYFQAFAVTSSTLSMAAISLQRFMLVKYPVSSENRRFHTSIKVILLFLVWLLSAVTSLPVLFVRKQETITLVKTLDSTFTFCLEHWQSASLRKAYSVVVFITVYVIPSTVLLYCQLHVGHLIREYEKRTVLASRLQERRSFNRLGFRVRTSASSCSNTSDWNSTTTTMGPNSDSGISGGAGQRKRQKHLNRRRKKIAKLIIWTTVAFVLCWLPYNLVSLWLDVDPTDIGLMVLPFTLFLGHLHSAVNPAVYWFLNKTKPHRNNDHIEMRCELMRQAAMSVYTVPIESSRMSETQSTVAMDLATQRKLLIGLLGPVKYRRGEYL